MMQWIDLGNRQPLQWLGQNPTHQQCMDQDPNYPACYTDALSLATVECAQRGSPAGCVQARTDELVRNNCLPACAAYLRGGQTYPWGVYSQDTCEVQDDINAELLKQGYQPIARDCKMGPRTCGAANAIGFGVPASCLPHRNEWVAPTKGPPPATTPPPVAAPVKKSRGGLAALLIGGTILGALAYAQGG